MDDLSVHFLKIETDECFILGQEKYSMHTKLSYIKQEEEPKMIQLPTEGIIMTIFIVVGILNATFSTM